MTLLVVESALRATIIIASVALVVKMLLNGWPCSTARCSGFVASVRAATRQHLTQEHDGRSHLRRTCGVKRSGRKIGPSVKIHNNQVRSPFASCLGHA
jgi:hypothetical protein